MKSGSSQGSVAFTLIVLLVAFPSSSILAAMLLPDVRSTKERGQTH